MITTIFWDFDGVLINSGAIRDSGFALTLQEYPEEQVAQLMEYHHQNGGLSRYVKFRYFFEQIRQEPVTQARIDELATAFSSIMRVKLTDKSLLIRETIDFVAAHHQHYIMHIVSGSDEQELRFLCEAMDIDRYFRSIHGSPTPKTQLVADLLAQHQYPTSACILIGDSINDYEAARDNGILFREYQMGWGFEPPSTSSGTGTK